MDEPTETEPALQSDWPSRPAGSPPERPGPLAFLKELPVLIAVAFILALLMKTFLIQAFYIPSESMEPTLHGCPGCNGDRVLVNKLAWRLRAPARGEIVVFIAERDSVHRSFLSRVRSFLTEGLGVTTPKETDFIKRIVGLPDEVIEVTSKGVYITPRHKKRFKLKEPYIARAGKSGTTLVPCGTAKNCPEGPSQKKIRIPADSYFVMGDNREDSADRAGVVDVPRYGAKGRAAGAAPSIPIATVVLGVAAIMTTRRSVVRLPGKSEGPR
jgi:signal peptidase I